MIERVLYYAKSTINLLLLSALNVVQYYNVRLTVIANVATATTIAASDERKQCQIGGTGKRNIGCAA
jgi:hypothetical protein